MKFAEKKQAYHQMQDTACLEPDRELLAKKAPNAPALKTGIVNKEKAQCEILWALLDVASVEEINANRPAPVKELTQEEKNAIAEEAGKLTAKIHNVATWVEVDDLIAQIIGLVKELPDEAANIMLKLAKSIIPDFVKKAEAEKELLAMDLETATQPVLAAIARTLRITPINFKTATLRPLLDEYRLNLHKISEGTEELESENEDIQDKLEEVEAEKNELEEQLENAEAEKELLEEQLEETAAELVEAKKKADTDPV